MDDDISESEIEYEIFYLFCFYIFVLFFHRHAIEYNESVSFIQGCFFFILLILISTLTGVLIICLTANKTSMRN